MSNMKAALLTERGNIETTIVPIPNVENEEILVRVATVGVCGSDIAVYKGEHPYKKPPIVLGHELCGTVERVGEKVKLFTKGDRVCCASFSHCGHCAYCLAGTPHICNKKEPLSYLEWQGGFAEYVLLKQNMTHKISNKIDFNRGALIEPLTIGLHAVRLALCSSPKTMAILGAGSIGLSCLIAAKKLKVEKVIITDISSLKSNIASKLSADAFINTSSDNLQIAVSNEIKDQVDVTIIASGHSNAIEEAISITKNGGLIILVSYFNKETKIDFNTLVRREISIKGSALCTPRDFTDIITWLETKQIEPLPMITHYMMLSEADKAMRQQIEKPSEVGKIMLTVSK